MFKNAVMAGAFIGVGGAIFVKTGLPLTFTLGIMLVISCGLNLITGLLPLLSYNKDITNKFQLIVFTILGNILGAFVVGLCFHSVLDLTVVEQVVTNKVNMSPINLVFNGIATGILIGIGVISYRLSTDDLISVMCLVGSVYAFVLFGFEHVVANAFYLGVIGILNLKVLLFSGIGNLLGGFVIGCLLTR